MGDGAWIAGRRQPGQAGVVREPPDRDADGAVVEVQCPVGQLAGTGGHRLRARATVGPADLGLVRDGGAAPRVMRDIAGSPALQCAASGSKRGVEHPAGVAAGQQLKVMVGCVVRDVRRDGDRRHGADPRRRR